MINVCKAQKFNKNLAASLVFCCFLASIVLWGAVGLVSQLVALGFGFTLTFLCLLIVDLKEVANINFKEECKKDAVWLIPLVSISAISLAVITTGITGAYSFFLLPVNFVIISLSTLIDDLLRSILSDQRLKEQLELDHSNFKRIISSLGDRKYSLTVIERSKDSECPYCREKRITKDILGQKSFVCGYNEGSKVCLGRFLSQNVTKTII